MNCIQEGQIIALLLLISVFGVPLLWFSYSQDVSEKDSPLERDTYRDFMAHKVSDVEELADWYRATRDWFAVITPPASDFVLRQPAWPSVIPFSWKAFPPKADRGWVLKYKIARGGMERPITFEIVPPRFGCSWYKG